MADADAAFHDIIVEGCGNPLIAAPATLGAGFALVGQQVHVEVGGEDFYIDLLFYHLKLRCFFVIDLKIGRFKAEYAGKMNFYCNVVDDRLRHPGDKPTIGLILCQDKNRIIAEYALKGVQKAIGVSEYQLTRALPKELRSSLPTVEQMETELARLTRPQTKSKKRAKGQIRGIRGPAAAPARSLSNLRSQL